MTPGTLLVRFPAHSDDYFKSPLPPPNPEEHVPYLLKIRRYGEDTDTVRSEGEDTVEDTKIRSKIRTLSDRKEKIRSKIPRYGRRYQDTVEDTKIRRRYGDFTGSTNVQGAAHLISEPFLHPCHAIISIWLRSKVR